MRPSDSLIPGLTRGSDYAQEQADESKALRDKKRMEEELLAQNQVETELNIKLKLAQTLSKITFIKGPVEYKHKHVGLNAKSRYVKIGKTQCLHSHKKDAGTFEDRKVSILNTIELIPKVI